MKQLGANVRTTIGTMAALLLIASCGDNVERPRILFLRGGAGTAGFVDGGSDDNLSDIDDESTTPFNRGFGQLRGLLEQDGFAVEQVEEGPASSPGPIDLQAVDLARYAVVVFGSNNATYEAAEAARLAEYVHRGGGALFISDANWGSFWDRAPSSDQTFLSQFGLVMNQDGGGYVTISGDDLLVPDHPILRGVTSFQGEGVSPCTVSHDPGALAVPVRLAAATEVIRRNTAPMGPVTAPTQDDAALAVVSYGRGRVACHFDRNTFFNEHGGGSSIVAASNRRLASNLFAWLAQRR